MRNFSSQLTFLQLHFFLGMRRSRRDSKTANSWSAHLLRFSLCVNIAVLAAVCVALSVYGSSEPVTYAWGPPTAGRGILLSVYFAILVGSALLLLLHLMSADKTAAEHMAAALLAVQVLYKVTTPATAGVANPVAISNLVISAVHAATLYFFWRQL